MNYSESSLLGRYREKQIARLRKQAAAFPASSLKRALLQLSRRAGKATRDVGMELLSNHGGGWGLSDRAWKVYSRLPEGFKKAERAVGSSLIDLSDKFF